MWEKLKTWFKNSMTIFWARMVMLFSIIVAGIQNIGGIDIFHNLVTDKMWPWVLAVFGIITELARRRTAK